MLLPNNAKENMLHKVCKMVRGSDYAPDKYYIYHEAMNGDRFEIQVNVRVTTKEERDGLVG